MREKKRLIWTLYPSYLLITLISLAAVSWYAFESLKHFFIDQTASDLLKRAKLIERQFAGYLLPLNPPVIDRLCKQIGLAASTRITVVLPNGRVVGDSEKDPEAMDNHGNRPEFREAMTAQRGTSIRYSKTLHQRMMYVAIPLKIREKSQALLRVSIPLVSVDEELQSIQYKMAVGGILTALLAAGICLYVSRLISRPIEEMRRGAESFSSGDLEHRLHPPGTREMAALAEAMNQMAFQLRDRMRTVINQRNEIEAILSSMQEGIFAVDAKERVLTMNQAAHDMLKAYLPEVKGRSIQEVIRNRELDRFIKKTLAEKKIIRGDVVLHHDEHLVLSVTSTPLHGGKTRDENLIGALVVLNDVTQLRHLEKVRRDFVANVSHELKTPLTAIKGFVETLRTGALEQPEAARRFLGIIEKHVDRLSDIVEDLLQLSRIEQENGYRQVRLKENSIKDVIQSAIQICQPKAESKGVRITLTCDDPLMASVDPRLLEQAFVNLLDNAVKYSAENTEVRVDARRSDSEIRVSFEDEGIGIAKKHLPRLFERFYRVDPARSRKLGGTGLGLSIVKHIISAHGGHLSVESELGKGSVFTVHLAAITRNFTLPDN